MGSAFRARHVKAGNAENPLWRARKAEPHGQGMWMQPIFVDGIAKI